MEGVVDVEAFPDEEDAVGDEACACGSSRRNARRPVSPKALFCGCSTSITHAAPFYAEKPTPTRVVAVRTLKEAERGSAWRHQPLSMACETPLSTSITVESKAMSPFV